MSTRFSMTMEMSRLTRDGTAEPISRDQILRCERGQGEINLCSADHEQDWQPYPGDIYQVYIYIYIHACFCCLFSSHLFWASSSLDVPAGVTQEEGHRISHPPSFCGRSVP